MQINNVNLNNVEFQKSKQVSNQTEEKPAVQEKNITMMPDIRLSQVVLPDNKISYFYKNNQKKRVFSGKCYGQNV